jgi:hypothetical protein
MIKLGRVVTLRCVHIGTFSIYCDFRVVAQKLFAVANDTNRRS